MNLGNNFSSKIFFLLIIALSFFIGFAFRDYAPGGASADFTKITWPTIQSFKEDLYFSITNYGKFQDASYPFFYIFSAYINPFSFNEIQYLISNTIISFFTFLIFAFLLKKNFPKISTLDCYLSASVILLLPFYRTSAYWGTTENLGWIFFVLALYFFFKIKFFEEKKQKIHYINPIAFCFLSSCCLYIRPALIFLPITYMLYLFLINKNTKTILISVATYLFLSIPAIILFIIWGGIFDTHNMPSKIMATHSYKFIFQNIPIISSYFAFYLFPILLMEIKEIGLNKFVLKYVKSFVVSFLFLLILLELNHLEYLKNLPYGGGAILKLSLIIENSLVLMIISSAIGFSLIYEILKENLKFNICVFLPIFFIYGFPNYLFQEYFEPLIVFIFISGLLSTKLVNIFYKNINISNIIILLYFLFYSMTATYYYL